MWKVDAGSIKITPETTQKRQFLIDGVQHNQKV